MSDDRQSAAADPSALDKTYRPAEVEAKHYARWESSGAFAAGRGKGKPFAIVIPPPNVTGSLHMGHALNNTLQDTLVRYRRMKGDDVLWQPGTDHAGIATQMVVERQLAQEGIGLARGATPAADSNKKLLNRAEFIERVWKWKAESGGTITRQLRRLGASVDWQRERFTMDEGLSAAVLKVFVELYRAKLIYRDKRLVNWDPHFHTAISDLEVEQREVKGQLWHFKYPIEGSDAFIIVATTRPETMLADTAVAVHPDDARFKHLVGKHAILPLVGRRIRIVADEYSDPEKGTGAVKITPGHDFNDFEVGRRHDLEAISVFTPEARINENAPAEFRGLDRFEARKRVVAAMEEKGLLEKVEAHTHMVPHGDRSGVPIEPYLTDQWYVDAKTLAQAPIKAVETGATQFVPKTWEKTFFHWMTNIQPWAISRQLWWGHQIPAWYAPDGTIFVDYTEEAAAAQARAKFGNDVKLTRDEDVLDTWFSSALWAFSTLGWPEQTPELKRYYPTSVLVTGFDIIFFWVARMMMMGHHFMKDVPFRTVYIHGIVRDERGQKMSKSKGNVVDPIDLIDRYGADALRFTLASLATPGSDVKPSTARIEGYRNFATKLWNAARYCQMNNAVLPENFDPASVKLTVNRWIVGELAKAAAATEEALDAFRFNDAANAMYQFTWGGFCDWYLEFTKPVLNGTDEAAKAETRATTAFVLTEILKLLHPVMPFITEELWEKFKPAGAGMLMLTAWPDYKAPRDDAATIEMNWVVQAISEIRTLRAEMNVPPAARMSLFFKDASAAAAERLKRHAGIIQTLARLERIDGEAAAPAKGVAQIAVPEATLLLPLAGIIDATAERVRLTKEIAKLVDEVGKIDKKLGNPNFVAKADPEVVEEQRERRTEAEASRTRLAAAMDRLSGL